MLTVTIEVNVSDNFGYPLTLSASVASNEPIEGLGDGDMMPDWTEPSIDQTSGVITVQLRAERSGTGEGRIYTVTIAETDESGNSSTVPIKIVSPRDKGKKITNIQLNIRRGHFDSAFYNSVGAYKTVVFKSQPNIRTTS